MPASSETPYKLILSASNVGKHTASVTVTLGDNYPDGLETDFGIYVETPVGLVLKPGFIASFPAGSVSGDSETYQLTGLISGSIIIVNTSATGSVLYNPAITGTPNIDNFDYGGILNALYSYITPPPTGDVDLILAVRDVRTVRAIYHSATSDWSVEVDYFPAGTTDTLTLVDHGTAADLLSIGITVAAAPVDGVTTITMNPTFAIFQTEVDNTPKIATVTQWEQLAATIVNGNGVEY